MAHQQLAACITSQFLSTHPRMNAFVALAELRGAKESTVTEVKVFWNKRINPLVDQRNRAVHDPRMKHQASEEMHRLEITARPSSQFGFKPEPITTLQALHTKIHTTVSDFSNLRDRLIAEIEALPPESHPKLSAIIDLRPAAPSPASSQ